MSSVYTVSVRDARPERNQTPDQIQEVTKGFIEWQFVVQQAWVKAGRT